MKNVETRTDFRKHGLNARLATPQRHIDKVGQDANNDEWVKNYTSLDFSASQCIQKV
jgi:hypothetical protein